MRTCHLLFACSSRFAGVLLVAVGGCSSQQGPPPASSAPMPSGDEIVFADQVESNSDTDRDMFDLQFVNSQGEQVTLDQYVGAKNVVLVVTRGFSGMFCPYCTAQTSRLIRNYDDFAARDAEVIVVYPGKGATVEEFADHIAASVNPPLADIPFPIVLDEGLLAVDQLMIRGDLAKPATYILDKQGAVRFAYVGRTPSDRPSLKAMLAQLDRIQQP